MTNLFEKRSVVMSPCKRYRCFLRIVWDEKLPQVAFVGLNPSTADEFQDDPTIRRCKDFAKRWGYGGLQMYNLFAVRATDPRDMKSHPDPIGPWKDVGGCIAHNDPRQVVCCWGTGGGHLDRDVEVVGQLDRFFGGNRLVCLGVNADGSPKHPLYLKATTALNPYPPRFS